MAIIKQVWNAKLRSHGDAEAVSELAVVKQDRDDEILFSIVESQGAVRRRVTFSLNGSQAMGLARFLGGIAAAPRASIHGQIDDEQTPVTLPGRPIDMPEDPEGGE